MKATLSFARSMPRFSARIALIILLIAGGVLYAAFVWCSKQVIDIATKARRAAIDMPCRYPVTALSMFFALWTFAAENDGGELGNAIRYNCFRNCSTPLAGAVVPWR